MDTFIFKLLIGFLLVTFSIILPLVLVYSIRRKKSSPKMKWIIISILSILQLWFFYSIYTAFYPQDSFYFEEYETVVRKTVPKSAEIISKSASYPDIHGNYCSVSLMKLSDQDYGNLYRHIYQNKEFENPELVISETLTEILNLTTAKNIVWRQRKKTGEDWNHYFIGFLKDRKSIIIYYIND
ncbi:hypothetical protein [Pedobacter sp. R-06]|uniref:hypothetical protein n=1 Tax=Pedobacter sp. R-06 TaxID=3404051 RepID=UPI003CF59690